MPQHRTTMTSAPPRTSCSAPRRTPSVCDESGIREPFLPCLGEVVDIESDPIRDRAILQPVFPDPVLDQADQTGVRHVGDDRGIEALPLGCDDLLDHGAPTEKGEVFLARRAVRPAMGGSAAAARGGPPLRVGSPSARCWTRARPGRCPVQSDDKPAPFFRFDASRAEVDDKLLARPTRRCVEGGVG